MPSSFVYMVGGLRIRKVTGPPRPGGSEPSGMPWGEASCLSSAGGRNCA
jgi:hypothetical protein